MAARITLRATGCVLDPFFRDNRVYFLLYCGAAQETLRVDLCDIESRTDYTTAAGDWVVAAYVEQPTDFNNSLQSGGTIFFQAPATGYRLLGVGEVAIAAANESYTVDLLPSVNTAFDNQTPRREPIARFALNVVAGETPRTPVNTANSGYRNSVIGTRGASGIGRYGGVGRVPKTPLAPGYADESGSPASTKTLSEVTYRQSYFGNTPLVAPLYYFTRPPLLSGDSLASLARAFDHLAGSMFVSGGGGGEGPRMVDAQLLFCLLSNMIPYLNDKVYSRASRGLRFTETPDWPLLMSGGDCEDKAFLVHTVIESFRAAASSSSSSSSSADLLGRLTVNHARGGSKEDAVKINMLDDYSYMMAALDTKQGKAELHGCVHMVCVGIPTYKAAQLLLGSIVSDTFGDRSDIVDYLFMLQALMPIERYNGSDVLSLIIDAIDDTDPKNAPKAVWDAIQATYDRAARHFTEPTSIIEMFQGGFLAKLEAAGGRDLAQTVAAELRAHRARLRALPSRLTAQAGYGPLLNYTKKLENVIQVTHARKRLPVLVLDGIEYVTCDPARFPSSVGAHDQADCCNNYELCHVYWPALFNRLMDVETLERVPTSLQFVTMSAKKFGEGQLLRDIDAVCDTPISSASAQTVALKMESVSLLEHAAFQAGLATYRRLLPFTSPRVETRLAWDAQNTALVATTVSNNRAGGGAVTLMEATYPLDGRARTAGVGGGFASALEHFSKLVEHNSRALKKGETLAVHQSQNMGGEFAKHTSSLANAVKKEAKTVDRVAANAGKEEVSVLGHSNNGLRSLEKEAEEATKVAANAESAVKHDTEILLNNGEREVKAAANAESAVKHDTEILLNNGEREAKAATMTEAATAKEASNEAHAATKVASKADRRAADKATKAATKAEKKAAREAAKKAARSSRKLYAGGAFVTVALLLYFSMASGGDDDDDDDDDEVAAAAIRKNPNLSPKEAAALEHTPNTPEERSKAIDAYIASRVTSSSMSDAEKADAIATLKSLAHKDTVEPQDSTALHNVVQEVEASYSDARGVGLLFIV